MTAAARTLGVVGVVVGFVATTALAGILAAAVAGLGVVTLDVPLALAALAVAVVLTFVGAAAVTKAR